MRLDQLTVSRHAELSRSQATRLIDAGQVLVNGQPSKPSYQVRDGDNISFNFNLEKLTEVPNIKLPVVYEDDDCIVINKPVGVLTHSKGAFNPEATVATWLAPKLDGLEGERGGIVHRLDRATSGVMICAKTPQALKWLQKQFATRKVKKNYVAIVAGTPKEPEATIDMPIERNAKAPATFRVGANGKPAVTSYTLLESNGKYSMLELSPQTGRTHQLRVHLAKIGNPIVGDTLYGGEPAGRMFLHAKRLELTLPSRERKVFEVALPTDFQAKMKQA